MLISEAKVMFDAAFTTDDAVLMTGVHGIGKSEVVKEWCDSRNLYNETIFLSMFEIGDLLGIPDKVQTPEGPVTNWAQPDWFQNIIEAAWPSEFSIDDLEFNDKDFEIYVKNNALLD